MATVIDSTMSYLGRGWEKSRIPEFLDWWKYELVNCLPKVWQERLNSQPAMLTFSQGLDGRWTLSRVKAERREAERAIDIADTAAVRRAVGVLESLNDQSAERRILVLSADKVLRKRLSFRLEVEPMLRAALINEMDKNTPFKADQVYFAWQIIKRDATQRQLTVDLIVVPRPVLDEKLQALTAAEVSLDAVDVSSARGNPQPEKCLGVNLLPSGRRMNEGDPQARLRWILLLALVGLIGLVMWQSLQARREALDHLRERTESKQKEAMLVVQAAESLRQKIAGANFLVDKRHTDPEVVKVMLELTQLIPSDTFVDRITFSQRTVALYGQSSSAEKLIGIFEQAKFVTKPQFQGVIQPDPGTNKERFSLQLELKDELIEAVVQNPETIEASPASSSPASSSTSPGETSVKQQILAQPSGDSGVSK